MCYLELVCNVIITPLGFKQLSRPRASPASTPSVWRRQAPGASRPALTFQNWKAGAAHCSHYNGVATTLQTSRINSKLTSQATNWSSSYCILSAQGLRTEADRLHVRIDHATSSLPLSTSTRVRIWAARTITSSSSSFWCIYWSRSVSKKNSFVNIVSKTLCNFFRHTSYMFDTIVNNTAEVFISQYV